MGILLSAPNLQAGERRVSSFVANHAIKGRAVGGMVVVTDQAIHFTPHRLDFLLGAKRLRIELADVVALDVTPRDLGEAFKGGLRDRLVIRTDDGEDVFVVNRLNDRIEALERSVSNRRKRDERNRRSDDQ